MWSEENDTNTGLDILQKNGNLLEEISKHQRYLFKHITKEVR